MEIFRETALGAFLARRSAGERRELFQSYLRDFLLLTVKVSTCPELKVRWLGVAGSRRCGRVGRGSFSSARLLLRGARVAGRGPGAKRARGVTLQPPSGANPAHRLGP